MKSMTGYGQGVAQNEMYRVVVDIKSVNGRFLDITTKAPRQLLFAEEAVKKIISGNIARGTVDVFVNMASVGETSDTTAKINIELARQLFEGARLVGDAVGVESTIKPQDILRFSDVVTYEQRELDKDAVLGLLVSATEDAVKKLVESRKREGESLARDLSACVLNMRESLERVKTKAPLVKEEYSQKLRERISEALGNIAIDESRFLNEIAFFVDKADINEEIVRLQTHIEKFGSEIKSEIPVGKNLEFLAQEMLREINTLGSKANNIDLTNEVLILKAENEKIKEQIRNCE